MTMSSVEETTIGRIVHESPVLHLRSNVRPTMYAYEWLR